MYKNETLDAHFWGRDSRMKSRIAHSAVPTFKYKVTRYLLEKEVVMNWSTLNKCILMLFLGSLMHVIWAIWKSVVLLTPELWRWVNLALLKQQLVINLFGLFVFIGMIGICHYFRKQDWTRRYMPYIAVATFVVSLCRDGYLVGVLSPATMVTYISLLTVGLVLFERRIVYSALIPATLYLVSCGYLSFFGQLTYAPLFLLTDFPYKNGFWVLSMLFFIVPILLTCLVLFEILLSQWRYREALIAHLSQVDPLTNTFNRRSINQCLEQLNHKQAPSYAVILVDLDHFKQINDEHGHHKGDEALVQVCHVLAGHIREQDVLGRFGGEEFILVLKQATAHQAKQVAERCRQAITQIELYDEHNQPIHFTASFGIALSHHNTPYEKLLSQADQALYQAKAYGRNQVVLYQPLEPAAS